MKTDFSHGKWVICRKDNKNKVVADSFICADKDGYYLGSINDPNVWGFSNQKNALRAMTHLYCASSTQNKWYSSGVGKVLNNALSVVRVESTIVHRIWE